MTHPCPNIGFIPLRPEINSSLQNCMGASLCCFGCCFVVVVKTATNNLRKISWPCFHIQIRRFSYIQSWPLQQCAIISWGNGLYGTDLCRDRALLHSPGSLGFYVWFEVINISIFLPQPPDSRIIGVCHHACLHGILSLTRPSRSSTRTLW